MKIKLIFLICVVGLLAGSGCRTTRQVRNVKVGGNKIAVDAGRNYCWSAPVYNKAKDAAYLIKIKRVTDEQWKAESLAKVTKDGITDPIISNDETFKGEFMPSVLGGDIVGVMEVSDNGDKLRVFVQFEKTKVNDEMLYGGSQFFIDVKTKQLTESYDREID